MSSMCEFPMIQEVERPLLRKRAINCDFLIKGFDENRNMVRRISLLIFRRKGVYVEEKSYVHM